MIVDGFVCEKYSRYVDIQRTVHGMRQRVVGSGYLGGYGAALEDFAGFVQGFNV